jgi:hypothetical protein
VAESRGSFLRVEAPGLPAAWIARDVVVIFRPAPARDLVAISPRSAATTQPAPRASMLLPERLREARRPTSVEVLLGDR